MVIFHGHILVVPGSNRGVAFGPSAIYVKLNKKKKKKKEWVCILGKKKTSFETDMSSGWMIEWHSIFDFTRKLIRSDGLYYY